MTGTVEHAEVRARVSKWLGVLPHGWSGARLCQVAEAWTSNIDKHTVEGQSSVRLCNYTDVYKNVSITPDLAFMNATATPEQIVRFRVRRGDTIITKDSETADDIGIPAYVEYEADDLVCGYHLAIVRPDKSAIAPRFLYWVLASGAVLGQWRVRASGVTRVGLRSADLTKATIPLPPADEQRAVADLLDRETAEIGILIAKQEQLVTTLQERRTAVMELPLTELEWRMPMHAVTSLIQTGPFGSQLKSDEYEPGGTPVINPSHLVAGKIVPDPNVAVGHDKAAELSRHALRSGDVVVARRGELGRCAVVLDGDPGCLCGTGSALVRPRGDRIDTRFLALAFGSRRTRDTLALRSVGATMDNLNAEIIASLKVPTPPLDEQRRIVANLDEQAARIDTLIGKAQDFIELARVRRAALISAAVTGQFQVPGLL